MSARKLTEKDGDKIRKLYAEGVPAEALAERFGVTQRAIFYRINPPAKRDRTSEPKPRTPRPGRWMVGRHRDLGHGWLATNGTKSAHFPTWEEAMRFVDNQPTEHHITAEDVSLLESAFPWCVVLPFEERARFARELRDHSHHYPESTLDRLVRDWHVAAVAEGRKYAERGLMKARARA